jgi:hypothetical protein
MQLTTAGKVLSSHALETFASQARAETLYFFVTRADAKGPRFESDTDKGHPARKLRSAKPLT